MNAFSSASKWALALAMGAAPCVAALAQPGAAPGPLPIPAAAPATAPADDPAADPGWPRLYKAEGHEVVLHQPQVDRWENYDRIHIRAAIVIRKDGAADSIFGSVRASAPTSVDLTARTVFVGPRRVDALSFGDAKPDEVERLKRVMLAAMPDEQAFTMSLDRVFAAVMAGEEQQKVKEATINLDPPPIFASETPAVLVILAGKPRLEKVEGTALMFVANTNWDVFLDTSAGRYYLLNGDNWLTSGDLMKGKWEAAPALPVALSKLPEHENWADVKLNVPGKPAKVVPSVIVSAEPAELIVTEGKPQFTPIPNTKLLVVSNTDAELFRHMTREEYYLLAAGRWFRAKELSGPWSAATTTLPPDFAEIPEDSEEAGVLDSVPGTPQAQAAVLQATTPQKATINRTEVNVTVTYQGEPKFEPIETTAVRYAINTPNKVFLVNNKYYCCHEGVWFECAAATGPWAVCVSVPPAIYTIPASHPSYNVTHVYVYESTPTTVVVGSTAGYSGQYVANGVVLFGAGLIAGAIIANNNDDYWRYHYPPSYFSYGCGVRYDHYHGGYYRGGSSRYGPYGGAGAWSAYNPHTGAVSRGAYRYGPNGSASARAGYNPWTGNSGARVGASTPYGSWGRSAVTNGEDWARGGYNSGARGTVGGIRTSEGSGVVAGKSRWGSGAVVAKDKDGDLYVGKNGNAFKRDDDGNWSERQNGQWQKPDGNPTTPRTTSGTGLRSFQGAGASASTTGQPARDTGGGQPARNTGAAQQPAARNTARTSDNKAVRDVDRQAQSRDRGQASSQRASQRSAQPAARPTRSGGGGGGGGRSGGRGR